MHTNWRRPESGGGWEANARRHTGREAGSPRSRFSKASQGDFISSLPSKATSRRKRDELPAGNTCEDGDCDPSSPGIPLVSPLQRTLTLGGGASILQIQKTGFANRLPSSGGPCAVFAPSTCIPCKGCLRSRKRCSALAHRNKRCKHSMQKERPCVSCFSRRLSCSDLRVERKRRSTRETMAEDGYALPALKRTKSPRSKRQPSGTPPPPPSTP